MMTLELNLKKNTRGKKKSKLKIHQNNKADERQAQTSY